MSRISRGINRRVNRACGKGPFCASFQRNYIGPPLSKRQADIFEYYSKLAYKRKEEIKQKYLDNYPEWIRIEP
jgi:hypothetical protein